MERDPPENPSEHQPTKAELEDDVRIDATPEALAWTLTRGGAAPEKKKISPTR